MEFDLTLKGNCILSAEDNEVNRIVLEHTLAEQDLPFVIVNDGQQAVDAWRKLDPVLILMDISMPIKNGYEAIEEIRAMEAAAGTRVPIIAVTAHAMRGDDELALSAGADRYITKPINPDDLLKHIADMISPSSTKVFA